MISEQSVQRQALSEDSQP